MSITLKQIQDNIETYCTLHKQLLHGAANKSFVRLYSQNELQGIRTNGSKNVVVVTTLQGRLTGHYDNKKMQQVIGLRFACLAGKDDGIQDALNRSFEIMMDFITRWQFDYEENDCRWLKYIDWENISWEEIDEQPWLQNHYGWDLTLPLKNYIPEYKPENWT